MPVPVPVPVPVHVWMNVYMCKWTCDNHVCMCERHRLLASRRVAAAQLSLNKLAAEESCVDLERAIVPYLGSEGGREWGRA